MGSMLNLTRNSVKARIKKMISKGVIQEYIADINFSILGYRICYIVTKQVEKNTSKTNISNSNINRRNKIIKHLTRFGDILAEIEVLGGSSIFRIATNALIHKETQLKDYNKINSSLPASMIDKIILADDTKSIWSTLNKSQQTFPAHTDLKVVKCLVSNPNIGIADIANLASISTRTANRIINRLKDYGMVRFSVICDPEAMKRFVVFGLLICVNDDDEKETTLGGGRQERVNKTNSRKIVERLYSEFPEYPFLRSPPISDDNIIITSVYG
ncbi:MAG: winged helix-turn-helix transcriptional regulator, partial [Nitrososphaeraceae archaeon]